MGILLRKHYGDWMLTGIAKLAFILFFSSLSVALINTVWAIYLDGFFHNDAFVGFFSGFLSLLTFLSFFFFVPLIEKSNKIYLYSAVTISTAFLYLLFSINKSFVFFVILSIAVTLLASIRVTVGGILVKDKSGKKSLSENEGFVYSLVNVAWVVGPLIAGLILFSFGVSYVFLSSAFLLFLAFILFRFSKIHDGNISKRYHNNVFGNFLDYFKDKERVISYLVSMGVSFWWALIYLYIPLFMIENGLKVSLIGVFLFAIAFPLIILEYPFSKLAAKHGSKKFFMIGYFIVFLVSLLAFFAGNIYIILGLLVFGSIGMAMLEPTTETYFFKILKNQKQGDRFYGPYNTSVEAGLIVGKLCSAVVLLFLSFEYIFLLFSGFMFLLFLISIKARNVVEKRV